MGIKAKTFRTAVLVVLLSLIIVASLSWCAHKRDTGTLNVTVKVFK